jgi:hypothetical protein
VLEFYRREVLKATTERPKVRLFAPWGVTYFRTNACKDVAVPNNRIVELTFEEAEPLMRSGWLEAKDELKTAC